MVLRCGTVRVDNSGWYSVSNNTQQRLTQGTAIWIPNGETRHLSHWMVSVLNLSLLTYRFYIIIIYAYVTEKNDHCKKNVLSSESAQFAMVNWRDISFVGNSCTFSLVYMLSLLPSFLYFTWCKTFAYEMVIYFGIFYVSFF